MTEAEQILRALGELQRRDREELAGLDAQASLLAAQDPERASALEKRLMAELFPAPARLAQVAPSRRHRLLVPALGSCALAAAVMLWFAQVSRAPRLGIETSYSLVPPAPDAQLRSAVTAPDQVAPALAAPQSGAHARPSRKDQVAPGVYSLGRILSFRLRPVAPHNVALRVDCYAANSGKLVHAVPLSHVERDASGGLRVDLGTGPGSELPLSEGSWELLFYVAPATTPPISVQQVRARQCPEGARCLSFAARFVRPQPL